MLKINSFIYNVHYVQHVQIYCICEHPTYNCIALKKGEYRCSYGISFWECTKKIRYHGSSIRISLLLIFYA